MTFRLSTQAIEQIKRSPEYRQLLRQAAKAAANEARRFDPTPVTHRYERSIKDFEAGDTIGIRSNDVGAIAIEVGSIRNPAYAPLRRGVRATGLTLTERSK